MPIIIISGMPHTGESLLAEYLQRIIGNTANVTTFNSQGSPKEVITRAFRESLHWPSTANANFLIYKRFCVPDYWVFHQRYTNSMTPEINAVVMRLAIYNPVVILTWPSDWTGYYQQMRNARTEVDLITKRFKAFEKKCKFPVVNVSRNQVSRAIAHNIIQQHYRNSAVAS